MDIWSVGCVIYELFTSKILFPGKSNNEMLRCFMDLKGAFPKKMVKRGAFHEKHFENDPNMSFSLEEEDPIDHRRVRPVSCLAPAVPASPAGWFHTRTLNPCGWAEPVESHEALFHER